jgi:hypothetical protein
VRLLAGLVAALVQSTAALGSETLTCSTSFQGYVICTGPGGATSTECERDGMRFVQDSDGNRWTTSHWRDGDITTVTPSPER